MVGPCDVKVINASLQNTESKVQRYERPSVLPVNDRLMSLFIDRMVRYAIG